MLKKRILSISRIVISVVLIGWLVQMINGAQLGKALAGANLWFVLMMVLVVNVDRLLMSYKWNLLLHAKGLRLPLSSAVSAYYKSSFWGSLFLPTVGADAVRILEVSQQVKNTEDVISSVVLERIIGLVSTAMVGLLSLSLFVVYIDGNEWGNLVRVAALLAVIVVVFVLSLNGRRFSRLVSRDIAAKWGFVKKIGAVIKSYQGYADHKKVLAIFLFWTTVEQFFSVINWYLVARAVHIDIPFLMFLMFVPLIMMTTRLPISFDGFGVREVLAVYLFGLVGVAQPQAFLVAFITAIIARIATAPPTLYFFLLHRNAPAPVEVSSDLSRA